MASVFFSYSHADEALRDELEKSLTVLKRQGLIDTWHDRKIIAGDDLDQSIETSSIAQEGAAEFLWSKLLEPLQR